MAIAVNFAGKIKGNLSVDGHKKWVPVESFGFSAGRAISTSTKSREVSNPSFSELTFSRATDLSSPSIYKASIGGSAVGDVDIHLYQTYENTVQVYLKIKLVDAIVSNYSVSSSGDRPSETFSVNYSKVEYQYDDFDGKKKTEGTPVKWSLVDNKAY